MYDVDRDGYISFSDLETIVKHLVGSSLNEEQVGELITRAKFSPLLVKTTRRPRPADSKPGHAV